MKSKNSCERCFYNMILSKGYKEAICCCPNPKIDFSCWRPAKITTN